MKKLLALLFASYLFALPAHATWSIVVVNTRTGEVGVGSATCITNFDLEEWVPVIVVGKGAAAVQSMVDLRGTNRLRLWNGLHADWSPKILLEDVLDNGTNRNKHQYGISSMFGPSVTYSGIHVSEGIGMVTGRVGDLFYAIQGNVLTGEEPVLGAEAALIGTDGDLGQRLMAAMEGARVWGGDGRCSCDASDPTGCGAPPDDFELSAHCGFVFLARMGDQDGDCTRMPGCATGTYYLRIATDGPPGDPDPVFVLQGKYDDWRAGLVGRPDHILSTACAPSQALPADGTTVTLVTVALVDVDGVPLTSGGALVDVAGEDDEVAAAGAVTDHGDGTYSFPVTAGTTPGTARFVITADDGVAKATLYPYFALEVDPVTPLHAGRDTVAVVQDSEVALTVNVPTAAGYPYLILCSASGTVPGIPLGDLILPLNPDDALWRSVRNANNFRFQNTLGRLDGAGRAEATFTAPPGLLGNLIGLRLDWAALYFDGGLAVTNAVGFDIIHGPE